MDSREGHGKSAREEQRWRTQDKQERAREGRLAAAQGIQSKGGRNEPGLPNADSIVSIVSFGGNDFFCFPSLSVIKLMPHQ
jgi:hypothetical protein